MLCRIEKAIAHPDHTVTVIWSDGVEAGRTCDLRRGSRGAGRRHNALFARPAFDKPPEAVVQAIIVDAAQRGRGIGKILMAAAEDWAAQQGYRSLALYSKAARAGAHKFYDALGYELVATSHLFRRTLAARR